MRKCVRYAGGGLAYGWSGDSGRHPILGLNTFLLLDHTGLLRRDASVYHPITQPLDMFTSDESPLCGVSHAVDSPDGLPGARMKGFPDFGHNMLKYWAFKEGCESSRG